MDFPEMLNEMMSAKFSSTLKAFPVRVPGAEYFRILQTFRALKGHQDPPCITAGQGRD
jgi:hypothetical protein